QAAAGAWITGRGWDQNDWAVTQFPTHQLLSAATPNNPVVLTRIDGHALLANAKAMQAAKITKATKDPKGGRILRDSNGEPTGVFIDNAMDLIGEAIPEPT
ncbi:amidohydrolase family protein, partial [Pseudomonas otitidis]